TAELLRAAIAETVARSAEPEQRELEACLELHARHRAAFEANNPEAIAQARRELAERVEQLPLSAEAWMLLTRELDDTIASDAARLDEVQLAQLEQRSGHRRETWPALRHEVEQARRDAKKARSDLVVANLRLVVA